MSNDTTKADLKNAIGINTSDFAKINDLANLKSDVDKVDIDKLKNVSSNLSHLKSRVNKLDVNKIVPVPVDLSKLNGAVKLMLLKKMYIMLRLKIWKITYLILLTYLAIYS